MTLVFWTNTAQIVEGRIWVTPDGKCFFFAAFYFLAHFDLSIGRYDRESTRSFKNLITQIVKKIKTQMSDA